MNVMTNLKDFKAQIDREITRYLDKVIADTRKRDVFMAEALKYVKKATLAGGKRIRPAFMYYGYLAAGGKEKEKILKTAISIELVHMFLLIHDDIIDRDHTRHGIDTTHFHYEKIGRRFLRKQDFEHFGSSMAIIIGDMVGALGNQIIFESNFDAKLIVRALIKLQSIVAMTVVGQAQDILIEYKRNATEKEILRMYENKTAKYTVEGPLHLGATLGGADMNFTKKLSKYAIPIGIAFQIQDDILGIFGAEKKIGKKIGSDIVGGKQTLLVARARKKANSKQKNILNSILGKQDLTEKDIQDFKKVIIDTGALDYAKRMALANISRGKQELAKMTMNTEAKEFLEGIADYLFAREL